MTMAPVPSPHPSHHLGHGARKEKRMWKVDTFAPFNDGHQWRKYGEKKINNSEFPRYYYRCTYKDNMNCPATKQIQQKECSDPPLYSVTYYNEHTCNSAAAPVTAVDLSTHSSTGRAVSICFGSYGIQEPRSSTVCSPSTSTARHGSTPLQGKNLQLSQCSEAYSCGAVRVEQKPVCIDFLSCSTACQDVASDDSLSEELLGAGNSGFIRYYHFL